MVPEWSNYAFQFSAGIWKDRKTIFINGFCRQALERLDMTRWQVVSDGGPCFFQAKYDTETGNIFNFMFNGPYLPSKPSSQATVRSSPQPQAVPAAQRN